MTPAFLTIGHITRDLLPDRSFVPGGTVTFAALAARNLGLSTGIVTAAPAALRRLPLYQGITITGPEVAEATTFENIYRAGGREQYIRAVAPVIEARDIPAEWRRPGAGVEIVHLGPVAQECPPGLIDLFPGALVGVTPQGFMRAWDSATGYVKPVEWAGAAECLPRIGALILSIEDLPPGPGGQHLLDRFIKLCPLVVVTLGPQGCRVYCQGQARRVPAFPAQEVDPTGAGDVFAAAFLIALRRLGDPYQAARFANAAAACNIEKAGASGVPGLAQVEARLRQTPLA